METRTTFSSSPVTTDPTTSFAIQRIVDRTRLFRCSQPTTFYSPSIHYNRSSKSPFPPGEMCARLATHAIKEFSAVICHRIFTTPVQDFRRLRQKSTRAPRKSSLHRCCWSRLAIFSCRTYTRTGYTVQSNSGYFLFSTHSVHRDGRIQIPIYFSHSLTMAIFKSNKKMIHPRHAGNEHIRTNTFVHFAPKEQPFPDSRRQNGARGRRRNVCDKQKFSKSIFFGLSCFYFSFYCEEVEELHKEVVTE